MRTFVTLVLVALGLLGLVLVGDMVMQVAMARAEGSTSTGLDLDGQTTLAVWLIVIAALWVTSAWRLHVNGQQQAVEAAQSERLRRLNDRLRLTNASLQASDRIKDELLANTSHELRTPLTAILGFAEMLQSTPDPKARTLAWRIHKGGERLHHTVNGLLDMYKLQSGSLELAPEDLDAALVVRGTVAMLQPLARERGLDLRSHPADLVLPSHVDRDALNRILTNLIGNAIKFTEQGGVTVTADATVDHLVLCVVDSGIGIAQEDIPTLFLPFTQASTGFSRTHEGTGLGLAIVRQLVDLMGGQIRVDSRLGAGTMVQVQIPRWSNTGARGRSGRTTWALPTLNGGQVLAVGLGGEDVFCLQAKVEPSGTLCDVGSIGSAVREARKAAYDVVFLAASKPSTDRKRARLVRRIPGYSRTPLVRVGGEALPPGALRQLGYTHQIAVPLDDAPLVELLEGVLMDVEAALGVAV